jgi:hypothetical protein
VLYFLTVKLHSLIDFGISAHNDVPERDEASGGLTKRRIL